MKKIYLTALIVLALLTTLSLAFNGLVILGLLRARRIALDAQEAALETVEDARALVTGVVDDTFSYTFQVEQEIPIRTSIPFNEEVTVPIRTTIPISTTVTVPLRAGILGTFDIDVPVHTLIPVDLEFTVPISQTVDISTTVPLDVDVPVEIPLDETPLVGYVEELDTALEQLGEALLRLEKQLENPIRGGDEK
ncbi:MAG: hypothetical protein DRI48_00760 [Chloroflexi bacterium]|nr:MAG: hypothetical protein DRI48_00760 [Chloroflexota bacterium]